MNISQINSVNKSSIQKNNVTPFIKSQNLYVNHNIKKNEINLINLSNINKSVVKKVSFGGWKPESPENAKTIDKMVQIIKSPDINKIAVSGHNSPDGDSIGSCFACASMLHQATGKKVDCFIFGTLPKRFEYLKENLNGVDVIELKGKDDEKYAEAMARKHGKYDLAVSVDTSDSKLMAKKYYNGIYKKAEHTLKIDHHPYIEKNIDGKIESNNYADINLVDTSCGAASQLLMQFVEPLGLDSKKLSKTFNNGVYTAILTDTDSFKYINSPLALLDASKLLENGVNNKELQIKALGDTHRSVLNVKVLSEQKIQYTDNGKIAYLIEDDELNEAKQKAKSEGYLNDAKDIIKDVANNMPSIKDVEIGFKVSPFSDKAGFSIRSRNIDVSEFARKYGGGGHKNAAAFSVELNGRSIEEVSNDIINELNELIEKHSNKELNLVESGIVAGAMTAVAAGTGKAIKNMVSNVLLNTPSSVNTLLNKTKACGISVLG